MAPIRIKLSPISAKRKKSCSVSARRPALPFQPLPLFPVDPPFSSPRQSDDLDEDESEQEDSSVHSSSVRSDSSGRVKKNKRGRPAKKKKKSKGLPYFQSEF